MSDQSPSESVLLTEQRGRVRILTLNRPKSRNALSLALIEAIRTELAAADADDEVDVIILTGTDPAFSAGVDLRELGSSDGDRNRVHVEGIPTGHPWRPLAKPVIGAINGAAVTGGLRRSRWRATFSLPRTGPASQIRTRGSASCPGGG